MNKIKDWFKKRRERKEEEMREINECLMEAGYLCPDYKIHSFGELSDWKDGSKYMTCKNCGVEAIALSHSISPLSEKVIEL